MPKPDKPDKPNKEEFERDPVVYTPPPVPPRAAAAGYNNLIFEDDFETLDIAFGENTGQKWNAGQHWYPVPDKSCFSTSGSALTITVPDGPDLERGHVDLCTQWHTCPPEPTKDCGICFEPGGYYEARILTFDWDAWWLFMWNRIWIWSDKVTSDPMTQCVEIDILESDSEKTTGVWNTLHKNTSGDGGIPDEQNWPHIADCNTHIVGYWHNYGVLWTPELLTFFVDEMPVREVQPYPSTWQPVMLILTAGKGGVGGGKPKKQPPTIKVDWVRVWH